MNRVKLSSIIDIISGGTPKTDVAEYWEGGTIGWLSVTNFNDDLRFVYTSEMKITEFGLKNSNTKLLQKGDIIISARGTVGALAQIGTPMCFNQSCFGLRGKKNIADSDFLYYCLKNYVQNIKKRSQGSVFDTINLNSFDLMEIEIPKKITTQQQIASVLSSLDSKIELNNRINAELEAMAKTVYDYWFVQFDFPNAEGKPYKSSGGKMVWCEELKRKIPEGWKVSKIGKLLRTSLGGTPSTTKKEYWENGTISWLNSGEIANFPIIDSELKITEAAIKNSATDLLPKGSVMLSITRHLRPSILGIDACANQSVIGIKESGDLKCYFLYPYLQNEIPRLMSMRSGAQQPHINKEVVDESFILTPPDNSSILKSYNSKVGNIYESIINNAFQNQQLSSLRDWLLPMLMNGQVKVEDVEEELEEMMAAEPTPTYRLAAQSNIPNNKRGFAKQVLGGKIVKMFKDDNQFTHIKFQKLQYLAEQIIEEDLDWNYYRQMAGPYDNKFMHSVFSRLEKNNWFKKCGNKYQPLGKVNDIDKYYQNYFGDKSEKLNKLFDLLKNGTEKFCEAVATIYAVWNNHIILKQEFNKERVKVDFFDWSNRKTAVFTDQEFEQTLVWMQNHEIVPTGFGELIKEKK